MIGRLVLLLGLLGIALAGWASTPGISVADATVWIQDDAYLVDLTLDYQLPEEVVDALDHGVPLVFVISMRVERPKVFWWQPVLKSRSYSYSIRYRPLAALYEVEESRHGEKRRFVTREAVFGYLSELRQLEVVEKSGLKEEGNYQVAVKAELDIESLPPPMRPMAYLTPSWNQSSGWSRWPLNR